MASLAESQAVIPTVAPTVPSPNGSSSLTAKPKRKRTQTKKKPAWKFDQEDMYPTYDELGASDDEDTEVMGEDYIVCTRCKHIMYYQ